MIAPNDNILKKALALVEFHQQGLNRAIAIVKRLDPTADVSTSATVSVKKESPYKAAKRLIQLRHNKFECQN